MSEAAKPTSNPQGLRPPPPAPSPTPLSNMNVPRRPLLRASKPARSLIHFAICRIHLPARTHPRLLHPQQSRRARQSGISATASLPPTQAKLIASIRRRSHFRKTKRPFSSGGSGRPLPAAPILHMNVQRRHLQSLHPLDFARRCFLPRWSIGQQRIPSMTQTIVTGPPCRQSIQRQRFPHRLFTSPAGTVLNAPAA